MRGFSRGFVWAVCLTYVGLALIYNALTPIGEAPDEMGHFEYARRLLNERRLPGARDELWQGHQAPLYYVALAAWWGLIQAASGCRIDPGRLPGRANPTFGRGPDHNFLVHGPSERFASWGCIEWTFHLLRLLSTVLTVPMILLTFAILREVAPDPAVAAIGGSLAALLPSHVAISAMLNNDALVNLLIVATTYAALVACRTGDAAHVARAVVLAAIAATAKLSGLYLFGIILVTLALRRELLIGLRRPQRIQGWLIAAAGVMVGLGFVLARNLREWGDPFAVGALETNLARLIADGQQPPGNLLHYYGVDMVAMFANSFHVAYGAVNFRDMGSPGIGRWGMRLAAGGLVLSLFFRAAWRGVRVRPLVVMIAGFALFFATFVFPGYRYRWLQVRYFFNQLPLIAFLASVGTLTLWRAAQGLGARAPDLLLVAVVYLYLVGLNVLVLTYGVIPHLYRYVDVPH